MVENVNKSL